MTYIVNKKDTKCNGESVDIYAKYRACETPNLEFSFGTRPTVYQAIVYYLFRGNAIITSNNPGLINYLESICVNAAMSVWNAKEDTEHYLKKNGNFIIQLPVEDTEEYTNYILTLVAEIIKFNPLLYDRVISLYCDNSMFTDEVISVLKDYIYVESFSTEDIAKIREGLEAQLNKEEVTETNE